MKTAWLIVAAGAVALAWSLWPGAHSPGDAPDLPIHTERARPAEVEAAGSLGAEAPAAEQPLQRSTEARSWHLRIVDADGSPCADARAFAADGRRFYRPAEALATAGADGVMVFAQAVVEEHGAVVVSAPGLRSREVDVEALDASSVHVVALVPGYVVTVDVVDTLGQPRAGVELRLSAAALHVPGIAEPDLWPGSIPSQAVFATRSDASGQAGFTGLWDGAYEIRPADPLTMVMGRSVIVRAPGHARIVVGEVHGVAVEVDDEVLFHGLSYSGTPLAVHYIHSTLERGRQVLREAFPSAVVDVAMADAAAQRVEEASATLILFARHSGWHRLAVPMRALGAIRTPDPLPLPKGADQTAVLAVEFVQEDGAPLQVPLRMKYAGEDRRFRAVHFDVAHGDVIPFPAGRWQPVITDRLLASAAGALDSVELQAGGRRTLRVVVPGQFRMGQLEVRGPGLAGLSTVQVELRDARGRHAQTWPAFPHGTRRIALPVGQPTSLLCGVVGYGQVRLEIVPPPGTEPLPIEVELQPEVN